MSSTPTDDEHNDQCRSTPSLLTGELSSEQKTHLLSPKPKHATASTAKTTEKIDTSMVEKTEDYRKSMINDASNFEKICEETDSLVYEKLTEVQKRSISELRIETNGRNILDLDANLRGKNLKSSNVWQQQGFIRFAHLPENNLKMFLENRSQYHRLGANGHLQEYALVDCQCCDFTYPINGYSTNNTSGNNIIKSIKTNINGQMACEANITNKVPEVKNDFAESNFTRPSTQNQFFSSNNALLKQQCPEQHINFDNSTFNNNITALNRTVNNYTNQSNNNIFENIAAALLNTTNNVSAMNHGLNQKHFNNNNHHYFNNQLQQQAFGGNFHHGNKNHYTSHSYSYKQF